MAETMKYKNPVCRGSYALGTACGVCERCLENRPAMPDPTPPQYVCVRFDPPPYFNSQAKAGYRMNRGAGADDRYVAVPRELLERLAAFCTIWSGLAPGGSDLAAEVSALLPK